MREARAEGIRVVFVTGDREWLDNDLMTATLRQHRPGAWLLNGGCRGADEVAQSVAYALGFQPIRMDAVWTQGGKAGPIRNRAMGRLLVILRDAGAEITAYVFHDQLDVSKGTKDMISVLDRLGIPWWRIDHAAAPAGGGGE